MGIRQKSAERKRIEDFLETTKHGQFISYQEIQNATDVIMNNNGKALLRRAYNHLRIEVFTVPKEGIKRIDENDSMFALDGRLTRINSAVKKAEKTHGIVQKEFFNKLSDENKRKILFVGAAFGAIAAAAKQAKLSNIWKEEHKIEPSIPKLNHS